MFTEYRGSGVYQGSSGAVKSVDGIDIWTEGEPDRPYRIIGTLHVARTQGTVQNFLSSAESALVNAAKEHGGDAIVMHTRDREAAGISTETGAVLYTTRTRVYLIKYE